jgi:uncharacterized membrane protein YkvA (DUF1232 family)
MPLKIVLEIGEEDLAYYRRVMDAVWKRNQKRPQKELIDGARRLLKTAAKVGAPNYVQSRLADLDTLCSMLDDSEWPLEPEDRDRIIAGLGYFAVAHDMIPDKIPGIGLLDDALMADLVSRDLKPELDGYRDFCQYRDNEATLRGNKSVSREDWLAAKRRQIWLRIKRRQEESRRHTSRYSPTPSILRYR